MKLWQAVATFDGTTEQQLLSWFQRHLRWWVVDLSRRKILRTVHGGGARAGAVDESNDLDRVPGDATSPSRLAGISEQESQIRSAGGGLSNEQLTLVTLHDLDGVPLKEIAHQLGASPIEVARLYISGVSALRDGGLPAAADFADRDEPPRTRLLRALEQLPAGERQAVLLKHIEGYTMEEAAQALDTTPAAIGAAVYRGMKALRLLLAEAPLRGGRSDDENG